MINDDINKRIKQAVKGLQTVFHEFGSIIKPSEPCPACERAAEMCRYMGPIHPMDLITLHKNDLACANINKSDIEKWYEFREEFAKKKEENNEQ